MPALNSRRSLADSIIFLSTVMIIVGIDRWTKIYFSEILEINESIIVIPHALYFSLVHNTGIAFGLFKDSGFIYFLVPMILVGLLVYNINYYRQHQDLGRYYIIAFGLILGGAIGNLIDRILFGYVIDFIDLRVWPVFNIADSAITIGAGIILLKSIFTKKI